MVGYNLGLYVLPKENVGCWNVYEIHVKLYDFIVVCFHRCGDVKVIESCIVTGVSIRLTSNRNYC
jgi:hypothetical protein